MPNDKDIQKLVAFARELLADTFSGNSIDVEQVQDRAVAAGLLLATTYDPAKHVPLDFTKAGDEWFEYAPWFRQLAFPRGENAD